MPPTEVANAERFERFGFDADALTVAQTRQDFAQWLQRFFDLDAVRCSDVVLAINEALANSAEFAYVLADRPGTVDIQGVHDNAAQTLTVTVSDRGVWRPPQPGPRPRTRGRGIPLMEALSDEYEVDKSPEGTRVRMAWHRVGRR